MSVASALDTTGVAVITGGASGFGLEVASRLVKKGMPVAILDVSKDELDAALAKLTPEATAGAGSVLAIKCDVRSFAECEAAQKSVAQQFADKHISFLFNNAGIHGDKNCLILKGDMKMWESTFAVNLFGAVHINRAFLKGMIAKGALPSGKKTHVVTTSSVVGLLHTNPGPYSVSKFAVTAMSEQLSLELAQLGAKASHISPHILHPSVGATGFLNMRGADGKKGVQHIDAIKDMMLANGALTAEAVCDLFFKGLDQGHHNITVDGPLDIPMTHQLAKFLEDKVNCVRPRAPEPLGTMVAMMGAETVEKRKAVLSKL